MKKISLIIPIYNTEKYLEKCLNSAINQTYRNMEFICVDDGSTDNSGIIADEFAKRDNRVVVIHQKNSGESHARNVGLKASTGDYIAFLDCDDWLEPDMYSELVRMIEDKEADLAAVSWIKEFEEDSEFIRNQQSVRNDVFERDELLYYIYKRDAYQGFAYMWDKLYKKSALCNENGEILMFDEKLKLGGDVLYLAQACLNVKKAVYQDKCCYHYRQRSDSGCHMIDLNRRMDWLKSYQKVIELFEKENINSEIMNLVKRFLGYHSSNTAEIAYEQKDRDKLKKCIQIMSQYRYEYEKTNMEYPERIKRYQKILNYVV